MKLILLFGPPAVGKLTVAKELQKITGYTLIHNHMILNPLSDIFGYENPIRRKLEHEFRQRIFEEAIKNNMNIITTGVIMRDNEKLYRNLMQMVKDVDGDCLLIQLIASKEMLLSRVGDNSRKELHKISTSEAWTEFTGKYPEIFKKLPGEEHMIIDTAGLSAKEVAEQIVKKHHV